ncbi:hypothetical protein PIB30_065733 [Stylosanthes scabra]|uniref:Uncharacterized protein n=1 Tax=Stylosanthes scabra TaxID=79078 RepID=A0ABU6SMZ1_9FABA|nr:hypothetical protein [Stylosanthes scabra]
MGLSLNLQACLHSFGFRPSWHVFLYIYNLLPPPTELGFMSFCAHQGWRLFDAFEESIQEFKWHCFKVLLTPITDHNDAEVGVYLDSLLERMEKQTKLDRLRSMMADVNKMGARSILPAPTNPGTYASPSRSSQRVVVVSALTGEAQTKKVPPAKLMPETICIDGEDGAKVDPSADLKQKRWKCKHKDTDLANRMLGDDSSWEHKVHPVELAFPEAFNYREALDAGITCASVRKSLGTMPPEQLLGTAHLYACKLAACLQVGLEGAVTAKLKSEKELLAAKDQIAVLKVERNSALAFAPLQAKVDTLTEQLSVAQGERLSALEQLAQLEEDGKVRAVELQSCQTSLEQEQKKVEASEKKAEALSPLFVLWRNSRSLLSMWMIGHWQGKKVKKEDCFCCNNGTFITSAKF